MINVIKKQINVEATLRRKLDIIFVITTPNIDNGSIRKI